MQANRTCSVDGCDDRSRGHGLCGKHYTRWRKHGDPLIVMKKPGRCPTLGFSHEVSTCDVSAVHSWMNRTHPRTGRCEWCGRTDRRTEYACAGHRYTRNRADWFELCRSCHKRFDGAYERTPEIRAKLSASKRGTKASPETRAKLSAARKGKPSYERTPEIRARMSAARRAYLASRAENERKSQ